MTSEQRLVFCLRVIIVTVMTSAVLAILINFLVSSEIRSKDDFALGMSGWAFSILMGYLWARRQLKFSIKRRRQQQDDQPPM
jgi:cytochrome c biogenesis factor